MVTLSKPLFVTQMILRRHIIYLHLMEIKKDLISSKQACRKKDLLILQLMDVMVFSHTASPVVFSTNDPQADIVYAGVNGTLNVLKSCVKVASVKRVVFKSSMAAVMHTGKPLSPHTVIDETWFSDPAICDSLKVFEMNWYILSKILAEDAAWKFAQENGIDLVAIKSGISHGSSLPANS